MRAHLLPVCCLLGLAACAKEQTPQEKARADAKAVAMVEAVQRQPPPLVAVVPELFTRADLKAAGYQSGECRFIPQRQMSDETVFLAGGTIGLWRLDGRFQRLAADSGSSTLAGGSHVHYVGKTHSVRLAVAGEAITTKDQTTRQSAALVMRDALDRVVYATNGILECGSGS